MRIRNYSQCNSYVRNIAPGCLSGMNVRSFAHLVMAILFVCTMATGQNTISTVAGGGTFPPFSTPAMGNYADIPGPASVITDSNGNIYVASPSANQIFEVASGTLSVFAGQGWPLEHPYEVNPGLTATSAYFNGPSGLAIDGSGNIYIADTAAYIVWGVNTKDSNVVSWTAGSGEANGSGNCGPATKAGLGSTTAVATDKAGNVYIADAIHNEIWLVNMTNTAIKGLCGSTGLTHGNIAIILGNGQLNSPQGLAVDSSGNIYISDAGNHRILKMTPTGKVSTYAGTGTACVGGPCLGDGGPATSAGLGTPWQLYVAPNGDLYIADSLQQRIRLIIPGSNGQPPMISTFAGNGVACSGPSTPPLCGDTGPATAAELNRPEGVYGDSSGNIYIGDAGDQRIREVDTGNTISTFAGGGLGDGPAISAILASNQNVAVDTSGNLYIADTGNNRIRKLSGGMVTTIAGNGIANFYGNNNTLATNANLSAPVGIAVDPSGNVYIADTQNVVIRVLNTQSSVITIAGVKISPGELANVAGKPQSACAPNTTCYTNGQTATSAKLGLPKGIALDGAGNIYFADESAAVISEVTTSGTIETVAGQFWAYCRTPTNFAACGDGGPATSAMLNEPYSVAVDSIGNVYISDAGDNRVRVVNPMPPPGIINAYAFTGMTQFGPLGVPALMSSYIFPEYVALDSRGNLFVSGSSLYYTVQRIDADSNQGNIVASIAGYFEGIPKYFGYFGDGGPAVQKAQLNNNGVAVDSEENLYISDGGNNRVRLVSSSPTQGLVPLISIKPGSKVLNFGNVPINTQSTMPISVGNSGADDLIMGTATISGPPFSLVNANPCTDNLVPPAVPPPPKPCEYNVTFAPTQTGPFKGQLVLNDNSFGSPSQTIILEGTGQ